MIELITQFILENDICHAWLNPKMEKEANEAMRRIDEYMEGMIPKWGMGDEASMLVYSGIVEQGRWMLANGIIIGMQLAMEYAEYK